MPRHRNNNMAQNNTSYEVDREHYLSMIQDIIKRMADNSFAMKNWCIAVSSGLFGINTWNSEEWNAYLLVLIPIIMFWYLDSYYLRQERLFRGVYDRVRKMSINDLNNSNYSLKPPLKGTSEYKDDYKMKKVFFSLTEFGFYGILILLGIFICLVISL